MARARLYISSASATRKSLPALGNLATLYRERGRYAEAEPLYKRDLAMSEKARYAEAEPLLKRALSIQEKAALFPVELQACPRHQRKDVGPRHDPSIFSCRASPAHTPASGPEQRSGWHPLPSIACCCRHSAIALSRACWDWAVAGVVSAATAATMEKIPKTLTMALPPRNSMSQPLQNRKRGHRRRILRRSKQTC